MAKKRRRSFDEIVPGACFHSLTAIERVRIEGRKGWFWRCVCDCGSTVTVYSGHLKNGSTKGCGCAKKGVNRTHGMSGTPEYKAWDNARDRCRNPSNRKYPDYGGRGISMCEEWASSFDAFFAHMGLRPSAKHSLDRKEGHKGYEPGNCRWATSVEQNRNRPRYNRVVKLGGRLVTVAEASDLTGLSHGTILGRLDRGHSDEDALR